MFPDPVGTGRCGSLVSAQIGRSHASLVARCLFCVALLATPFRDKSQCLLRQRSTRTLLIGSAVVALLTAEYKSRMFRSAGGSHTRFKFSYTEKSASCTLPTLLLECPKMKAVSVLPEPNFVCAYNENNVCKHSTAGPSVAELAKCVRALLQQKIE